MTSKLATLVVTLTLGVLICGSRGDDPKGEALGVDGAEWMEESNFQDTSLEENSFDKRESRRRKFRRNRVSQRDPLCGGSSDDDPPGTCISSKSCIDTGGKQGDRCGPKSQLICCRLGEMTCSDSAMHNGTKFINVGYPSPDSGVGACSLTINRLNINICQMRFDFLTLELSQPDSDGNCVTDFLTVTGGTSASPIICGSNTGQHMYVDVDPEGGAVRLTVDRTAASMFDRMWNIQVFQIECTSKYRAPAGCLQYFTETSGTVSSFNFHQEINEQMIPQTTRQIVNMQYAVCIKAASGYCSVMWTRNTTGGDYAFTVSSNIAGISKNLIGDPASSSIATRCTTDYVVIPGGLDDAGNTVDRFCGAGFPNWVMSNTRPFIMFVTTDSNEREDVLNRGFSLDYRQKIC